jgi:phosphoglucomutase
VTVHPLAGQPAPRDLLIDVAALRDAFFARSPDLADPAQRVSFGTSGHRGSSLHGTFNEAHVLAITQAICDYRKSQHITGPLYIGRDTHALSEPAFVTALEVLAANRVETMIDAAEGYTPTPAVSHAILAHNRERKTSVADGIVITPSHNPPEDGGIKYNPPTGGPAQADVTRLVEDGATSTCRTTSRRCLDSPTGELAARPRRMATTTSSRM